MMSFKKIRLGLVAMVLYVAPGAVFGQGIKNPLKTNTTIADLIIGFTNFLLGLVGLLALLGIIWAGVRMILAAGNEQQLGESKKILFWSIAGLVVSVLSYVILSIVGRNILGILS